MTRCGSAGPTRETIMEGMYRGEMGRSLETTDSSHARGGVKSAKKTKTNIGSLIWMTRHSGVFIIHKTDISKAKKTSTVARGSEVRTKIMAGKQRRLK